MPTYYIDEIRNDQLVGSHIATGDSPEAALQKVTGRKVSTRALQEHWFRVVDEGKRSVSEFSYEHTVTRPRVSG